MESLWHPGPNQAADAVVLADQSVLLVKRRDSGLWALPGGFIDPGETSQQAARREVFEETGVEVASQGVEVYHGPVDDPRSTEQRWIESTAYLYTEPARHPVTSSDEVEDAGWRALVDLPERLHGSHDRILQIALGRLGLAIGR